jgi:hypothetical protein
MVVIVRHSQLLIAHWCNGRIMDKTRSRFSNSSPMGNGEKSDQHHKQHTLASSLVEAAHTNLIV